MKNTKSENINKLLILFVLMLAFLLRFWNLSSYPAFNADEAAIGYNAYSLIKTGLDEHGHSWPVHFQSFNDWKPGLYFYLVIPFIKILGLTELAVRLPNAILSVATVYFVYLLGNILFKEAALNLGKAKIDFGIVVALLLSISPWHIHFSRGGWEVNTATFFITGGILMFLSWLKNTLKTSHLLLSVLLFALSLYTYHAARIIVPLFGFAILVIYAKNIFIKSNSSKVVFAVFFGILILMPLVRDLISGDALSRAAGVGLFADKGPINRINEQRGEHENLGIFSKLPHNKLVNYTLAFMRNWSGHFQGEFLFMTGDSIQRNKVPETGVMYLFDIVFVTAGLIYLARARGSEKKILLLWIAIAPVAAALTFQAPHALRSQNMVIPLTILSALGLSYIWNSVGVYKFSVLALIMLWCLSRYLHMYYVHMAKEYPFSSQYGVKELVQFVSDNGDKYKNIVVSDRYDQPYILFLFYLKYSPTEFQNRHSLSARDDFGFSTVREFDKYRFENLDFDVVKNEYPESLIAGTPDEIPKAANVIKRIYGTNGYEYFDVVAN